MKFLNQDIDECNRNETTVLYKNRITTEIYNWKKCSEIGGICINTYGRYECKCISGYEGDGFICVDINECDDNHQEILSFKCPLNSKCLNYPGGFNCSCLDGYELKGDKCEGKFI